MPQVLHHYLIEELPRVAKAANEAKIPRVTKDKLYL